MKRVSNAKLRAIVNTRRRTVSDLQKIASELLEARRIIDLAKQYLKADAAEPDDPDDAEIMQDATDAAKEALEQALGLWGEL